MGTNNWPQTYCTRPIKQQTDRQILIDKLRKNKSFNTTTLIVVEPQFKSYFKCKIKGLDLCWCCSFQCYEFSRGKCFVLRGIVLKRECKTRIFFVLLQQGVFEGECLEGGGGGYVVNMWGRDVTLWLAGADLEHVCRAEL